MQSQIYEESWHWMIAFGHLAPVLHSSNKKEEIFVKDDFPEERVKVSGYFKKGPRVPVTNSQRDLMIDGIKRLLLDGVITNVEIYCELEELGLLPESNGKLFSEHSLSAYITQAKKDLFPSTNQVKELVVSMFKFGFGRKEIEVKLKTSSQYVRQCLIEAGLIEKQKSRRPRRNNQKGYQNGIS